MTLSRRGAHVLAVLSLALLAAGCAGTSPQAVATPDRLQVVTTVAPLTSIAANIAGGLADVTGIVPEGTNSHTFEPAPKVARVMERADVVFVNGLQLEEPTLDLARANAPDSAVVVELGTRVLPEAEWIYDFSFPKEDGKPNPHLWTDPRYAIRYADVIADTLARQDPAHAAEYRAHHDAFVLKATALANALRTDQTTVPASKRLLLTYHDAYAYFARDFGWKVIGAVQPANFEDPQPKEIARLVDQVRRYQVPAIFGSEVFPSRVLKTISDETGVRYEASLRDDDLPGKPGDAEHSWLGLMRYDFRTMVTALGGTARSLDALDVGDVAPDTADYPQ